ncbi:MAG: 4Fe-4S dicluster domain-containing protein [Methanobacteriota archaeon]|nr:MAG: 4Fe-4S dicluster domain-containing protein [Euryarchaeota archaeon]
MNGIVVDRDLCTRCGTCSTVCPSRIISAAGTADIPHVPIEAAARCNRCGHCEAFCPTGALSAGSDEGTGGAAAGGIDSDLLGRYIKSRRSVRHYTSDPVDRETIEEILDIARYAPSGMNLQPVQWLVVDDAGRVHEIARFTVDWMRSLAASGHPLGTYGAPLIAAWDAGIDRICLGAPHLLIAHIPAGPTGPTDAAIAMTHVDIVAPAFGVGTCWAGFVSMAAQTWKPLKDALPLPAGRTVAYAMMFGYPRYAVHRIPPRKAARISWWTAEGIEGGEP